MDKNNTKDILTVEAHAKINWYLDIVGKRADGYHLLESIMQPLFLHDIVTISLADTEKDVIECNLPVLVTADNLAYRAWLLLKERFQLKQALSIKIEKHIPLAAGLAGGSADCAAVLCAVNKLFGLGLSLAELMSIGLQLGTDVPFCLLGQAAEIAGVGEQIKPLPPLPTHYLLLANAGIPVSTAQVYRKYADRGLHGNIEKMKEALLSGQAAAIDRYLFNSLEQPAMEICPEIAEIKSKLSACGLAALMSGSGGTVFGLADSRELAEQAFHELSASVPFLILTYTVSPTL